MYQGQLPSESGSNTRQKAKQRIRSALHPQLAELWKQDLVAGIAFGSNPNVPKVAGRNPNEIAEHHKLANKGNHFYRFVPIVGERLGVACSLDILFLRRDSPGNLIQYGGDIDNRIKVLFDALRIPQNPGELPDGPPGPGEDPFHCLLEDDRFITSVKVTTDRLLTPLSHGEHTSDVLLVVGVKVVVTRAFPCIM